MRGTASRVLSPDARAASTAAWVCASRVTGTTMLGSSTWSVRGRTGRVAIKHLDVTKLLESDWLKFSGARPVPPTGVTATTAPAASGVLERLPVAGVGPAQPP